jgi:MerR family transcriptional regulator, redox-sensitive transcriptional activator SoxR
MKGLGIGEVARRVGMRPSAIRYYESEGLLPPPARTSGWRRFEPATVDRLLVIRAARELGFSLPEIRLLLDGFSADTPPPARWRALARVKLPEIDAAIRRAHALKRLLAVGVACECVTIEACFLDDCSGQIRSTRGLPIVASKSAAVPDRYAG